MQALPLLKRGRWLPALDDTVRANVPYHRFLTYRKAARDYRGASGAGHTAHHPEERR